MKEENIREGPPLKVTKVHGEIASEKKQLGEKEDLKDENESLKRHEAFLSKKMQAEKAVRDRFCSGRSTKTPGQLTSARTARFVAMLTRSPLKECSENDAPSRPVVIKGV